MFPRFVRHPTTQTEYECHRHEFDVGGLTGAAFSSDGTHVLMWNCSANLRQAHIGFKLSHPARAFNLTTNHRREILHSTDGSPARWNDKTLSNLDDFLRKLKNGEILQDVTFELMEWSGVVGNSAIKKATYRGGWGLVDNGHHKWSCMQAPSKTNALLSEQRLSDWIESFRIDSECVFGILKGRWRTLKTGVRLHDAKAVDRVWLTYCALHNRLLRVDGLSEPWEEALGENDVSEMRLHAPLALQRLSDDELRAFGSRSHEVASRDDDIPLSRARR